MLLRELYEQDGKTAVIAFGRLNPPTIGHAKLVDKIKSIPGDHYLFLSQTQKPKTDPLDFATKLKFAKQFFPDINVGHQAVKTPVQALEFLQGQGYTDVIFVAGSDRVEGFQKLFDTYNGQPDKTGKVPFKFNSIRVVSAGERDPDADDVSGMSASKMRVLAAQGELNSFAQGVPDKRLAKTMYDAVRKGMGVKEQVEPHEPGYQHSLLTMPANTLVIDTPGELDWYKIGQHFPTLGKEDPHEYGQSETDMVITFNSPEEMKNFINVANKLGLTIKSIGGSQEHPEIHGENFADGKKPGRKGLAKRVGVNTKASVSSLRNTAKNSSGEKQRMAHWLANMKAGRAKKKESLGDPLLGAADPVLAIYDLNGKYLERLKLSVAARKYKFDPEFAREQFAAQDKVKLDNVILSAPISGQSTKA